ncbi:hypothetical protein HY948_03395 [Candidatus Gottesmanbacteria bacterium]|nr:hypothetical protein [Candidatus Gottesmanbacteria bacterium]
MTEIDNKIKTELVILTVLDLILVISLVVLIYLLVFLKIPETESLYADILDREALEKKTADIVRIAGDTKIDREKLSLYFIDKESAVGFIEELESLSRQANVVLDIDSPLEEKDSPQSKQVALRFNVRSEGAFSDILYFLRLVENLPYKIFVDHVTLSVADKRWSGSASFRLNSYMN